MMRRYRFLIAISRGLVFGILGSAAFFSILQWQQPVLAQANAGPKSSVRVCVYVANSKSPVCCDDLIGSLHNTPKDKQPASAATIISVPLFKEGRGPCDYLLRLGRVESDYRGVGLGEWADPGYVQVEFWLSHTGTEKAIIHDRAVVTWNVSQGLDSNSKLMAIVAQRTLKAIEKDQRRPAKPGP